MVVDSCNSFTYTFRVGVKRFLRDLKKPDFVFPVHPLLHRIEFCLTFCFLGGHWNFKQNAFENY